MGILWKKKSRALCPSPCFKVYNKSININAQRLVDAFQVSGQDIVTMKIAVVSTLEESVPPPKYGGVELVVYNLVEELVKAGHQVTLFATGDSETSAKLVPIFPEPLRAMPKMQSLQFRDTYKYMGLGKITSLLQKESYDIVHNHIGWRLLPFADLIEAPIVTTLHGPLDIGYQQEVYGAYKTANYVSISLKQRAPLPDLNYVGNVYNGIRVDTFEYEEHPQDYFAFLGRMSPEKGPVQAIKAAQQAGVKLLMAAKVDVADKEFFSREVEPLIDGEQIKFIGEVDHPGKVALLKGARALLAPIQWEEPFGLFFVEAMACGTPVITMRRGSTPELIIEQKTGFICDSFDQIVAAINKVDQLDRAASREHVQKLFSAEQMGKGYMEVFEQLVKKLPGGR